MTKNRIYILILILSAAFFLRYYDIYKDPFYFSSGDKDAFVDSGIYTFNAKHQITAGTFFFEEYNYHLVFPLNTAFTFLYFKIAGINYFSLIKFFCILGLCYVFLFYLIFKNEENCFLYLIFSSFTFVTISLNRTGLTENYLLFWILLVLWCFINESKIRQFLCGFFIIIGLYIKTNFLPVTAAIIVICFLRRSKTDYLKFFISGIFTAILCSAIYFFLTYDSYLLLKESIIIRHIFTDHSGRSSFFDLFNIHTFLGSNFFVRCFIIYGLFLAGMYKIILNKNKNSKIDMLIIPIFIFTVFIIDYSSSYSPGRYRLLLIPFFIIGSAAYFKIKEIKQSAILSILLNYLFFYPFFWWIILKKIRFHSNLVIFFCVVICSVLFYFIQKKIRWHINIKTALIIFLIIELSQYYYIFSNTGYDLLDSTKKINKIIAPGKTVSGWWAPQICFNRTDIKVIPGNLYPEYFEKYHPDYLITANAQYNKNYTLVMSCKLSRPNIIINTYKKY
ncbi:hypothetical protein KA977_10865 [Candidatus Dependentiae bacterium]|nr:hypothetical protein [Candidatus Dependentiae bacterium]